MNQSNTYNISVRRVPKRSRKDRKEYSTSVIVESGGGSSPVMHNDLLNIIDVTEDLSDDEKGVHLTGALAKLLVTIDQARLDKWDKQPVGSKNVRVTDTDLGYLIETMDDYVSKTKADVAKGHITFEQGVTSTLAHIAELYAGLIEADGATILDAIITNLTSDQGAIRQLQSDNVTAKLIRSSSYAGGATGHGYSINDQGEAELKSLFIREFLEATEFRYNRVTVIAGESWRGPGAGLIKAVDTTARTITLKLEEGELATIDIDDICKAIYHTPTGFATAFFRITEKVSNDTYKYVLRSGYAMHPKVTMNFVAYGNFTNKSRQQSCYEARNYKRYLANVNNWDIKLSNIMMQLGDLSNLKTEYGLDMTGYSAYLNRIYMTGTIKQLSADGETVVPIPAFKGAWIRGKYYYYDEVTHIGCRWICIAAETTQEPADSSTDWLKVVDKGDPGISGAMLRPRGEWKPNTQYINNNQYRDTVIYNKNKYIVKSTHTSGSSFVSSQWESFNEFINVATQVLLADQAWIDILGAQGIAVGSDAASRWELTGGKIRHTATGLELTAEGQLIAPPGGIKFSNGKTIEGVINDKVAEFDYLKEAMQADTVINGGLVMSNIVAVRSGSGNTEEDIVAGMSGLKDDGVFFFADVKNAYRKAANYFKGLSSDKPLFGVSKGGFFVAMSGLIGCFQVAKDLITIKDSSGADKVKFTGELLDSFASQAQSSTGGTTGARWLVQSNNGTTIKGTTQQVMLTHTFTNGAESIYGIKLAQEQVFVTQVAEEALGGIAPAAARVSVNLMLRISQGSTVLYESLFRQAMHDCFTDNMSVTGIGNPSDTTRINAALSFSQRLPKGAIKLEVIALVDYSLISNRGVNGTTSSAISYLTPQSGGRFDLVSTDDETIIAADGMSIRLNSNNFFKLLKKAGEISLVFRGKVSPDSNIPALICGGEVNQWGGSVYTLGGDSKPSRSSTGHYIITLPDYMRGKSNYVVQLTGVSTDNVVTRAGVDTAANCFWVQTWQSPGKYEDAAFTYMVYRAK